MGYKAIGIMLQAREYVENGCEKEVSRVMVKLLTRNYFGQLQNKVNKNWSEEAQVCKFSPKTLRDVINMAPLIDKHIQLQEKLLLLDPKETNMGGDEKKEKIRGCVLPVNDILGL